MLKRLLFILLVPVYAFCQNFPAKPSNYVTDDAGILGPDEEHRLNAVLKTFEDSSSIQLFIYTSPSLNGATMADLTQKIFHEWKIGNKKTNNGVLIAVYVKDHKFRIHTGSGMEGILPDLRTKKIQDEIMRPYFKENNYFMGLVEGVNKIIFYSKHEYKPEQNSGSVDRGFVIIYAIQFVLFLVVCLALFGKYKGTAKTRRTLLIVSIVFLCIPFLGIVGLFVCSIAAFLQGRTTIRGSGSTYDRDSSHWQSTSWSSYESGSSSSDSGSSFDGGGGGDSGGGGSDSSW